MYRPLIVICILPLIAGCYLPHRFPPSKVTNEYIGPFTESIVRMRDGSDLSILNLDEGQRIGERAFRGFSLAFLLSYFETIRGTCNPSEAGATKYVCTVTKLVLTNLGPLGTPAGNSCDNLIYLTYEFYYPNAASRYAMWDSMRFYATTGDRSNCRVKITSAGYEDLYL